MISPLFSIITPMYKGASFVSDTIESVIGQSEKSWEMIIVDDCSPDNGAGAEIVKKYEQTDKRIKLIQLNENRGASGARNEAMRNAKGKYYAFLDADDIWDPDYLGIMLEHIYTNKNEKVAIFYAGYRRMNAACSQEILPSYNCAGIKDFHALLFHCPIFPSAAILDTTELKEKIFFREELRNLRDDYTFWLDITKQGMIAVGYTDILVNYRMRDDSVTASKRKMIKPQWNIYHHILGMNKLKSFYYLCSWALNGIKKYKKLNTGHPIPPPLIKKNNQYYV
jgi:glycosyltransferase involved in cell wall biosynthesis